MEEQIRAQAEGKTLYVVISCPRVNAAFVPTLKEQVAAALTDEIVRVVIDMSLVEFVDSSGVGAFLGILRRLPQPDGNVALKGMQQQVRAVFVLLRLQRIFQIED